MPNQTDSALSAEPVHQTYRGSHKAVFEAPSWIHVWAPVPEVAGSFLLRLNWTSSDFHEQPRIVFKLMAFTDGSPGGELKGPRSFATGLYPGRPEETVIFVSGAGHFQEVREELPRPSTNFDGKEGYRVQQTRGLSPVNHSALLSLGFSKPYIHYFMAWAEGSPKAHLLVEWDGIDVGIASGPVKDTYVHYGEKSGATLAGGVRHHFGGAYYSTQASLHVPLVEEYDSAAFLFIPPAVGSESSRSASIHRPDGSIVGNDQLSRGPFQEITSLRGNWTFAFDAMDPVKGDLPILIVIPFNRA